MPSGRQKVDGSGGDGTDQGGEVMIHQWVDCDRSFVSRRYDRIAGFIPLFDRLLFLPPSLRAQAVARMGLRRGDSVLDLGCGTGTNLSRLRQAVGPSGHVFGIDISPGMLRRAKALRSANHWRNVELSECDAADYTASRPLDGVLMSLSYNTMPNHRAVLRRAWQQLRPGGRIVIMDAKLPPGFGERIMLPLSLWLMKHTMLGNPLIEPWKELAALTKQLGMSECLFGSYYICRGIKQLAEERSDRAADDETVVAPAYQAAAE
jgi:demethylmenaquinone methyltransferase/2-methoxy-6-polyprenyl-1,4-benzoquinol methylase